MRVAGNGIFEILALAGGLHQVGVKVNPNHPPAGILYLKFAHFGLGEWNSPLGAISLDLGKHVTHGVGQELARATGRVQKSLVRLHVEHLYRHLHHVGRGEELTPVAAQRRADQFLVGCGLDLGLRLQQTIALELCDHVGDDVGCARAKVNTICLRVDSVATLDHLFEQPVNPRLHCVPAVGSGVLFLRDVEQIVTTQFIFDLAGDQFEQFPEGLIFGQARVGSDFVVTRAKGLLEIVANGWAQAGWDFASLQLLQRHPSGRDVNDPHRLAQATYNLDGVANPLNAVGPHAKLGVGAIGQVGSQLTYTLLSILRRDFGPFGLHDDVNVLLRVGLALVEDGNVHPPFGGP